MSHNNYSEQEKYILLKNAGKLGNSCKELTAVFIMIMKAGKGRISFYDLRRHLHTLLEGCTGIWYVFGNFKKS